MQIGRYTEEYLCVILQYTHFQHMHIPTGKHAHIERLAQALYTPANSSTPWALHLPPFYPQSSVIFLNAL